MNSNNKKKSKNTRRKRVNNKNIRDSVRSESLFGDRIVKVQQSLFPGRDAATPGKAFLSTGQTLVGGQQVLAFSFQDFNNWCAYARSILIPYRYFRVTDVKLQVMPSGGAASIVTTAYNISNSAAVDSTAVTILNDDYSTVANAITRPILHPPNQYWLSGSRLWYEATDPVGGVPVQEDCILGNMCFDTSGAAAGVACGYIMVSFNLHFHTLN